MGATTTHTPDPIDDFDLRYPYVVGWNLGPDRRVLVVYDDTPECPLDSWDHDCTFYWWSGPPPWDRQGQRAYEDDDLPDGAIVFRVDEYQDGNHYTIADDPDEERTAGYIIPSDDATNPREYVAAVLNELTLWATGECYGWAEETRVRWTTDGDDDRSMDTWDVGDSCWGYMGMDAVIEAIRGGVAGAEGVSA